MNRFLKINYVVLMALMAGCAAPSIDQRSNVGETATCEVCRYNNDLGCVCVKVKEGTPRAEYEGKPYYFCSEECRTAFQKRPDKYVHKPKDGHPGS